MLDPQARALLDLMEARQVPAVHTLTPVEARTAYRDRRGFTQPEPLPMASVRDTALPGPAGPIPLRVYRPAGTPDDEALPGLVYFHGGGWVIGDLDTHDVLCRELATLARCAVLSVDYRLGPEHRFPAAVDDAVAATREVFRAATSLGLDRTRIAIGGDSAGGNLAAVVALALRDAPSPDATPCFQLLIYPATDMRRLAPSHTTNGQGYLLTRDSIAYYHDHYIADAAQDADWRASPLLHPDLSRLPPALLLTAGHDPLRDEGLQYADALGASGNRCTYVCFERQIHGFITMGRVIDEAHDAVATCAGALRRAFGR